MLSDETASGIADIAAAVASASRKATRAKRQVPKAPIPELPVLPPPEQLAALQGVTERITGRPTPSWDVERRRIEAETRRAIEADFKVFLTLVWAHLGLGRPSDVQLSIADYLQHGAQLSVIMAFRGCGKSWITGAFALWTIYCNAQEKVMVVSGSMKRAVQQTTWCLALIREMPLLKHLAPRRDQRQSATAFDVAPATPAQSTSFAAFGITGQLVGQRAGLVIADDVETNVNSLTVMMREKLVSQVKELNAILTPGGIIRFLGTPQSNDSIYNKLPGFGYTIRIWPMVFPSSKHEGKDKLSQLERYGDKLSPWIRNRSVGHEGLSVWPERFGASEVARLQLAWGTTGFDLQFMLDTSLADSNRFPLKLTHLMVMGLDLKKGPDDLSWGKSDELVLSGMPLMGFPGDRFHKPANIGPSYSKWDGITAIIDPSDEGSDETAIAIGAVLNGRLFLLAVEGWVEGATPSTMLAIAKLLVKYQVNLCRVESNFGGSMFGQLLKPYVIAEWLTWNKAHPNEHGGTELVDERAGKVQKELRIIADLEPVTQAHRMVVSVEVIERDFQEVMSKREGDNSNRYSLWYQFCNLTRDKHCLAHDDRLDALAGLVGHYRDILGVNPALMARQRDEERIEDELQALFDDTDEVAGVAPHGSDPRSDRHTTGRRPTGWNH